MSSAPLVRVRAGDGFVKVEREPDAALRVDAEGRWITARIGPVTLRRKVDGGVFIARGASRSTATGVAATPGADEPADSAWHTEVAELAATLLASLGDAARAGVLEQRPGGARVEAERVLARAARIGPDDWREVAARFAEVYPEPVPILPPDRYRDLVVLPATGCPHGACDFCAWYREARFRALAPAELERHLDGVEALFGAGARARDGLFLGSASGLSVADERLLDLMARARARFGRPPRGVAAFLDPHHAPTRDAAAWARLGEAGLVRVIVGLESGEPELRARLGKPGPLPVVAETVAAARAGRVGVGLTVLTGAVRPEEVAAHVDATVAFIAARALSAADLVYVSPLDDAPDPAAAAREARAMTARLRAATDARVAPYRVDLYRYFA